MKLAILSFAHMHAYGYAEAIEDIPGAELVVISDSDENRGRQAATKFNTYFVRDYEEALKYDVDAVIICSANANHEKMVIAAAQAGKHILCEKPLATSVESGWNMISACEKTGVKLRTAFPIRFSTPIRHLKQKLDAGSIGRILSITGRNRGKNPGGWFVDPEMSGGGAVLDHTVHVVDIMRWYMSSEVKEVYAEVDTRFSNTSIDDCGILLISFENGVIASHDPSWSRPDTFPTWGDVTLRLIGTRGTANVDAFGQNILHYDDGAKTLHRIGWGDNPDRQMIKEFISSIDDDTSPLATGEDGLRALKVALAAYESSKTKLPVRVDK